MKKSTYFKSLMAPLLMLFAVACAPDQFNQTNEYDDVYFTSSDRSAQAALKTKTQQALIDQQQKQVVVDNYSKTNVDNQLVSRYNNGQPQAVTYYEDGPIVRSAQELNYVDFVSDYENGHLAHYELPLDWNTDWTANSFNTLMDQDFHFKLAWYDQYYLGNNFRMNQYLSGRTGRSRLRAANAFGGPRVGIGLGVGFNNFYLGFNNTAFLDLNPWGIYDPFWRPIGFGFGGGFGFFNSFYDPFYCPPFFNRFNGFGWRNGWRNNVFVNNNVFIDRRADRVFAANRSNRNVTRGPRVGTSRIATVRNEAVNGASPATRSSRYVDNLSGSRASRSTTAGTSRGRASLNNSGGTTRTSRSAAVGSSSSRSRVRTDAYNFSRGSSRASRSSAVRTNGSTSRSAARSSSFSRSSSRTSASSSRSSSRSNPSFSRSSSSRSSYSRGSSRSSSSRSSSFSRGSSSRSSGSSSRGSYSRGSSSSRGSSGASRGSSGSSRSSGGSSRSSGGSSRSSRGN